jgi:hypothetical protein
MDMSKFIRSKKIDGKTVIIYLLPASKGLAVAQKLSTLLLPTIGTFANGSQDGEGIDFQDAALVLTTNLVDFEVEETIKSLFEGLTVDNNEVEFDTYFMGNYGMLTEIIAFAVQENFSSFFTKGGFLEKYLPKPTLQE